MSMDLSFLQDVKAKPIIKEAKARPALPKLPENADLRVFGSGRVYPSKAFAEEMNLEFRPKGTREVDGVEVADVVLGNGLDIFASTKWAQVKDLPVDLVFITAVPKAEAKVDMWASTKYDEEGTPKASVFTQGASTFSKTILVPMLATIYGVDWDNTEYVDLVVSRENVIASETGIYHLPKIVSTGARKGEDTYSRRENVTICPLIVSHTEAKKAKEEEAMSNMGQAMSSELGTESANKAGELFAGSSEPDSEGPNDTDAGEPVAADPGADWADQLGKKAE